MGLLLALLSPGLMPGVLVVLVVALCLVHVVYLCRARVCSPYVYVCRNTRRPVGRQYRLHIKEPMNADHSRI